MKLHAEEQPLNDSTTGENGGGEHEDEEGGPPKSKEMLEWEEAVKRWINR